MNPLTILKKKSQIVEAYRAVFENPQGELVLEHLAKQCHLFEPTFIAGDTHHSALREGERRVILSIMKMIGTDYSAMQKMMENINVDTQNTTL